jgi:hypothetical protein
MTILMVRVPGSLTITTCRIGGRIEVRCRIGAGMNGLPRFE